MKIILVNQFKNESQRIVEWLEYYRDNGIKDFLLIDDYSTDDSIDKINSVFDISAKVITSTFQCTDFINSSQTEQYENNELLQKSIVHNFNNAFEYIKSIYNKNIIIGFIDLDEFIFSEDQSEKLSKKIIKLAKDFTIMTISSYEVDSRLFKLSEGKILMQTSRSMATRTRINCTRNWITKSFVNMASKQSNLAFTTERNQYWAQVHLCGIPIKTKKNYFTILIRNLLNRIFILLKLKKFELTISTENLVPKSDYDSYSYSDILTRPAPNQLRFLHYRIPSYDLKKNGDLFDMDYQLHR